MVWLVQSNVVINGSLSLDGRSHDRNYPSYTMPTEPGPGGFRGGANALGGHGAGFGPGSSQANLGGSASSYGGSYGNPQLQPLMGGSGGGAAEWGGEFSGPSGGGAILIGTGGTTIINGQITARAGQGFSTGGYAPSYVYAGHGAIRLIARQLQGNGAITAGLVQFRRQILFLLN